MSVKSTDVKTTLATGANVTEALVRRLWKRHLADEDLLKNLLSVRRGRGHGGIYR